MAIYLPRIYCDMDGVLCDFKAQASKVTGMSIEDWMAEPGNKFKTVRDKWKPIKDDKDFWRTLPWQFGGQQLWSFIKKYEPHILSAYVEATTDPNCIPGKTAWVKSNLGIPSSRINLVRRREKQNFAMYKGESTILIDDYVKNITQFSSRGGRGILHTSTPNTISQLKKLGFD